MTPPPHPICRRRPMAPTAPVAVAALLALLALAGAAGCSDDPAAEPPATTATTAPLPSTTTTEAPLEAGERAYVYEPEVGDCFDRRTLDQEDGGERIVLLVDCGLPHQFEVFAVVEADPAALPPPTIVTTTTAPPPPDPAVPENPEGDDQAAPPGSVVDEEGTPQATATSTTTTPPAPGYPGQDVLERYARQVCPGPFEAWVGTAYVVSELEIAWVLPEEPAWANGDRTIACTVYDPATERMVGTQAGSGR